MKIKVKTFDVKLFQIFLAVCQFKSFSKAGNYLYLDQSTVSKRIRQLENNLGRQLFTRLAQGVALTSAGEQLRPQARRLLADFSAIQGPFHIEINTLRVGFLDNIAAYHYSSFLAKQLKHFKKTVISSKGPDLIQQFNDGLLDAIIINRNSANLVTGTCLQTDLTSESFGILAGQPFAKGKLGLADLAERSLLIAPHYCPVSQELKAKLPRSAHVYEVGYTNTLLELVAASDYLSILPWKMVHRLVENDRRFYAAPLTGLNPRTITLVTREAAVQQVLTAVL